MSGEHEAPASYEGAPPVNEPQAGHPEAQEDGGEQHQEQHQEQNQEHHTAAVDHAHSDAPAAEQLHDGAHEAGAPPASAEAILDAGRHRALELAAQFAAAGDSGGTKRKLEGHEDGPDAKRAAGEDFPATFASEVPPGVLAPGSLLAGVMPGDAGSATEVVMCPSDKVGRIIGRAGATIRDLEASTGTRVQVDHKAPGDKPVTISGRREDVERCKRTIQDLISGNTSGPGGDGAPGTGEAQRTVECPQGIVGRVIGRGGETIRSLQQASGAHILVNQDFPDGVARQITITGSHDAVERAANMVTELINGEHANTQAVIQRFGVGSTEVMECPRHMVGRIIGKGGETIKDLQKRFSASIQIDQQANPCKVTITGPPHAINGARRAIDELIRTSSMPPMGGGGGGPPRPFPAPYPAPYPAPGGYGGYGGYPPAGGYGAPGGYPQYGGYGGGYPPQGYGQGYGGYGADPYAAAPAYGQGYGQGGPQGGQQGGQQQGAQGGGSAAPSSSVWQALPDDQGRTYYYNSQTGVSQWEKPADMP